MMRHNSQTLAVLIVTCAAVSTAMAQRVPDHADVPYALDHERQVLDLYLPAGATEPTPLVVWIHGGGWQNGDKAGAAGRANLLLPEGVAVAGINYRLSQHASCPAQIHDCKGAIRWLRANAATYNIDPDRIGVWGPSAGGHLAALIGASAGVAELEGDVGGNLAYAGRVQVAADFFGPTDFFSMGGWHEACDSPESLMLGYCLGDVVEHRDDPGYADIVAFVASAAALMHVGFDDPPFFIAHGDADAVVPLEQSLVLSDALANAGVGSTLLVVEGGTHGLSIAEGIIAADYLAAQLTATPIVGDVNGDRDVDLADFAVMCACMEDAAAYPDCSLADVSGDGDVDIADVVVLQLAFTG